MGLEESPSHISVPQQSPGGTPGCSHPKTCQAEAWRNHSLGMSCWQGMSPQCPPPWWWLSHPAGSWEWDTPGGRAPQNRA